MIFSFSIDLCFYHVGAYHFHYHYHSLKGVVVGTRSLRTNSCVGAWISHPETKKTKTNQTNTFFQ